MKAKLQGSYRKKDTGNRVFRYVVSGTQQELDLYAECVGDNLVMDDTTGKPLYFTTRYIADDINLIVTSEKKVVTDDTELSKLQSLVEQYGIDVARLIMLKSQPSTEQ